MKHSTNSLVSAEWLASHLHSDDIVVLDASRHLPDAGRDPRAEYEAAHIPGARFLELASLVDDTSAVPQALPRPDQLAEQFAKLGIAPGARLIIYDDSAVKTAARAWFMATSQGFADVAILNGGLAKWRSENRPLESGNPDVTPAKPVRLAPATNVATKADMLANLESKTEQILDARSAARVFGAGTDPVHGGENGRIPGALNLPFGAVFNGDGTFKSRDELRTGFVAAGVDLDRPVVTTCGSGVTASVLLFALHLIGKSDIRLYDGSWSEWNADPGTPKAQGTP
jgi:thiosulfate/3-mercaptopyruvate sulfurtransferase